MLVFSLYYTVFPQIWCNTAYLQYHSILNQNRYNVISIVLPESCQYSALVCKCNTIILCYYVIIGIRVNPNPVLDYWCIKTIW